MERRKMLFTAVVSAIAVVGVAVVVLWRIPPAGNEVVINDIPVPPVPTLSAERVAQGEALYAQSCASCHGGTLEGAPDWRKRLEDGSLPPPPHDNSGHTWHHADAVLIEIIRNGGNPAYGSRMPAFRDALTEEQITAILDFIKSKWGKEERELQWWMTFTRSQ